MKLTIKVVLLVSLFTSTALLTHADGDTGQGNRCETGCLTGDGVTTQSFEIQPTTSSNTVEATPESSTTTSVGDGLDSELLLALWIWLGGFPL